MKNPKYTEQLYAIIFLCLGCAFIVFGLLSFGGILTPTPHSMVQNNIIIGIVFSVLGIIFFITQIVFAVLASKKKKLHWELLTNGIKVSGTVEKVYMQKYMQYGQKSPYRVLYTYTYQNKTYHSKSCLLWDKPQVKETDSIEVYANVSGAHALLPILFAGM